MSGHSKWSQIKRQKQSTDQKRGLLFSKLARAISIAVKQGGGQTDPNTNLRLRLLIDKARQANMPKENIQRALMSGNPEHGGSLEELVYEGFGPGGIALLIEVTTDNPERSMQQIKQILRLHGGQLAARGAVSHLFNRRGIIIVDNKDAVTNADEILSIAADTGALDLEVGDTTIEVYTRPEDLHSVKQALLDRHLSVVDTELTFQPNVFVTISDKPRADQIIKLLQELEELGDVQRVNANFNIE